MQRDDDDLDAVVESASELITDEFEQPIELPAFSSVVARARRIDPNRVDPSLIRSAWASDTNANRPEVLGVDPLATFIRAARVEAEADIRNHIADVGEHPEPAATLLAPKRWHGRWIVAAAAAAVLLLALAKFVPGAPSAEHTSSEHSFYQSVVNQRKQERRTEVERADTSVRPRREHRPKAAREPSDEGPEELICHEEIAVDVTEPIPSPIPLPDPASEVTGPSDEKPDRETRRDALRKLDDRAEDALARGDLTAADELYREVIRQGGRSRRAERAYGDRFTIARRLRIPAARVALWREYLREFPRGRFAEDAHAGLCREQARRKATSTGACWQDLLDRFPQGLYANQARRALEVSEASDSLSSPRSSSPARPAFVFPAGSASISVCGHWHSSAMTCG